MHKKIVIVGGGSAGWMTAATLCKNFPEIHVTLVESPNIAISGVGESTITGINEWMNLIGVEDKDFMKATDAVYKLSIKFENFYKNNDGGFHYPFSYPYTHGTAYGLNDWHYKKFLYPETPNSDYADSYYSIMALVNENKFDKNTSEVLPNFRYGENTAYHFDATKFGLWLKKNVCLPNNVEHVIADVKKVHMDKQGAINGLELENSVILRGDLYIDCTGFRSILLEKTLKEPFESYRYMLPNDSAWATRIPYTNKMEQMEPYTSSTALNNGWVWNIPLWSRIGTGYVYSSDHVTDEEALEEFKKHLSNKGVDTESLEFKNIKMRVGIHERIWVKNCVAIGLSAGFIEPLESNGLYTVHKFLVELCRTLLRSQDIPGVIASQFDIDAYNMTCRKLFKEFAVFVSMHYALTQRQDTKYWKDCFNRTYDPDMLKDNLTITYGAKNFGLDRMLQKSLHPAGGFPCIASGMGYNPVDRITEKLEFPRHKLSKEQIDSMISNLESNKKKWRDAVKYMPTMYDYLNNTIYKED